MELHTIYQELLQRRNYTCSTPVSAEDISTLKMQVGDSAWHNLHDARVKDLMSGNQLLVSSRYHVPPHDKLVHVLEAYPDSQLRVRLISHLELVMDIVGVHTTLSDVANEWKELREKFSDYRESDVSFLNLYIAYCTFATEIIY